MPWHIVKSVNHYGGAKKNNLEYEDDISDPLCQNKIVLPDSLKINLFKWNGSVYTAQM